MSLTDKSDNEVALFIDDKEDLHKAIEACANLPNEYNIYTLDILISYYSSIYHPLSPKSESVPPSPV
jgi:hypothetical protein